MTSALIIVDMQNDFCRDGSLAVPGGDEIVPMVNRLASMYAADGRLVVATRDWHPAETSHFVDYGGVWPAHCVADTPGAAFHPDLRLPEGTIIVSKGTRPGEDAFSGFDGLAADGRTLERVLRDRGVTEIEVVGLATDYCDKATALDGVRLGFDVFLLLDAIAAVNLQPGDGQAAIDEMTAAGVRLFYGKYLVGDAY